MSRRDCKPPYGAGPASNTGLGSMDEVEEACLRALQIGPHYAATVADLGELREDFGPSRNRRIQAKLAAGMMIAACRRGTTGLGARDLVDGNGAIWWAENRGL